MPNRYFKYSYSERRKRGSEGLRGEVYIPPKASDSDKKNFQHWLTYKIYEYAGLSQTARLIVANYIEAEWKDLKIVAPDLLTNEQNSWVHQYENPPKKGGTSISATNYVKTLEALDSVTDFDWNKLGNGLNKEADYHPIENSDFHKISKLGHYVGLSKTAHEVLAFVCTLNAAANTLQKALIELGVNRPAHFAHLMSVCFGGADITYRQGLDELYASGILESPLTDPKKLPAVSNYVGKLSQEHKTAEEMISAIFGQRRKAEFAEDDFGHAEAMRERVGAYIRKSLQMPKLAKGILLYGSAGVGKTEFAAVDIEGIETRFIGEPKADGTKLSASERLSALLLAIKLAGRRGKDQTNAVKLVFDEFEDVLRHFLKNTDAHVKEDKDHSKLMLNRLLEDIRSPVLFLANVRPGALPDYVTTRLILVEMAPPTGKHQVPIIKRLDRRLPVKAEKGKTKSGLSHKDMEELASLYDAAPRVWNTVVSAACLMPNPLRAAKTELQEYAKAEVAQPRGQVKLPANYDLRLVKMTTQDPFETPVDVFTAKLIEKARLNTERLKAGWDDVRPLRLVLDGDPGNGKTEYAKYVAQEIGAGVKSIKGGDLLTCWLGETEEKINELFDSAARENCAIIFEEADSILRTRQKATQSWEISFVNEFNACLDRHKQPVIFTTNLGTDLDSATRSRMQMLRFGSLDADQIQIACGRFFGNEILAGGLIGLKGITLRDFVNLRDAADLVDVTITRDNIKSGMSRIMRKRTGAAIA